MVGLFSVLDAMMDQPLEAVIESLPLSPDIVAALLRRTGPYAEVLETTLAYERGDWEGLDRRTAGPDDAVTAAYLQALDWAEATALAVHLPAS